MATKLSFFISLLLLFTLSQARHIQQPKPESEPQKPQQHPHDTVSFTLHSLDRVPLTFLQFRHRIPTRPLPLSLRTAHRRCRHAHRREIPYGNDAIVLSHAAGDDRKDGVRRIPSQWVRVHATAEPRFSDMVVRPDSDHEHHHHFHGKHHHHHEGWFAKRIRKFLNLF
ncbi:hypothetical protein RJT34_00289 [Clitoria ternatea]|uniref:Uncharacterized protein n=1 Tax=Clitoria ternatea TaxID=43366 RepID=A0AAN9KI51_CLITE